MHRWWGFYNFHKTNISQFIYFQETGSLLYVGILALILSLNAIVSAKRRRRHHRLPSQKDFFQNREALACGIPRALPPHSTHIPETRRVSTIRASFLTENQQKSFCA